MSAPDELRRRLIDLADAAGPWDDPLPEVRRRAEAAAASKAHPDRRRWLASTDWTIVLAAAAVAVIAVGLGAFLVNSGGPESAKTSSAAGGMAQRATSDAAAPCPLLRPQFAAASDAVRVIAPVRVVAGQLATVRVRLAADAGAAAGPMRVYVVQDGAVVARLDPATAPSSRSPSSTSARSAPSAPSASARELSATGAFTRTTASAECAVASGASSEAAGGGTVASPARPSAAVSGGRSPLSRGTYQLVAVVEVHQVGGAQGQAAVLVSRPVDVVVQ